MKRKIKQLTAIILCAVIMLAVIPMQAFAADERNVIDSGFCGADGENLSWTLYDDGELVISGEGEMDWYDVYSGCKLPGWYDYYDKIDVITVEEGVTSIGRHAFFSSPEDLPEVQRKYYKISLPKSLVFSGDKMFFTLHQNRIPGQHLAFCYAGSEEEWNKVEFKNCQVKYEDNKLVDVTYIGGSFGNKPVGSDFEKLYFNGEEPQAFCELITDYSHEIDMVTHYYSSDPEAEKIMWFTVYNGKETKVGEIPAGEYTVAEIELPQIKEGDLYIKAVIADAEGKIIVSSEELLIMSIPVDNRTFKEKAEYFFASVNFTVFFTFFFIVLPAVLSPITTVWGLLSNLFNK